MSMRRAAALAAGSLAVALGVGVVVQGAVCGAMVVGESQRVGEPPVKYGPECRSSIHPFSPALVGAALLGIAGVVERNASVPRALGLGVVLASAPLIFSIGIYGMAIGALLLAATVEASRPPQPPRLTAPLALATVGLLFGLAGVVALANSQGGVWAPTDYVMPLLAPVAWLATSARLRAPALALAAAALLWGLFRLSSNALGDLIPAAFLAAGAVLLARAPARGASDSP